MAERVVSEINWEISDLIIERELSKVNPDLETVLMELQDLIEFHLNEYKAEVLSGTSTFSDFPMCTLCRHRVFPKERFLSSMRQADKFLDELTCSGNYVADQSLCWPCNLAQKHWNDGFAKYIAHKI